MAQTIGVGDVVRFRALDATVTHVNGNGSLDVRYKDGFGELEYVPAVTVTMVHKKPPTEPGIGTMIHYSSSMFIGSTLGMDYVRGAKGWYAMDGGRQIVTNSPSQWTDFDHTRVRLYSRQSVPVA